MNDLKNFAGIKSLHKYGGINSYDLAKFLAISFMIVDHLGYFIFMDALYLRGLGRVAFPIFFFLIGYSHDNKNSWNLLILGAMVSVYRTMLTGSYIPFDILVTAFLSKIILRAFAKKDMLTDPQLFITYFILMIWHIGVVLLFSYGTLGILFAICGYLKRNENDGKPGKYTGIFILVTVLSDYLMQRLFWGESEGFKNVFAAVSLFLVAYFMNFRMRNFDEMKNKLVNNTILFFSRNSLFIYWLHYIVLMTISVFIYADKYVY